jgi:hypothetical protein
MFNGSVNFTADSTQIAFPAMTIVTHITNTDGATVAATADAVTLKVEIAKADSVAEAIRLGEEVAAHIANVLTFHFGSLFKRFRLVDHALIEEEAEGVPVHHISNSIGFFMKVDHCLHIGPDKVAAAKQALDQPHHAGYLFYDQFRAALSLGDPLARFMSLYNIVLSLSNDSQEDVDIFALQLNGATPTNAPYRRRPSGTQETVYTRLRNQVGHVRPGTTIEGTRTEMETWLPGLTHMAKELIARQP